MKASGRFEFSGDVGTYVGVAILSLILLIITLGIATPWVVCMRAQWTISNTKIDGKRLKFTGKGGELFGQFIVWALLCIVTLGIYSFWVIPRYQKWIIERTDFE